MSSNTSHTKLSRLSGLLIIMLLVAAVGTYVLRSSYAGTASTTIYLAPATGSYQTGSNFTVAVRVNSGGDAINVVSVDLSYSDLQYLNTSTAGSAYSIDTPGSSSAGHLSFTRGTTSSTTGDQLVATLTFQAGSTGSALITVANDSAAYRVSDSSNAAGTFNGGSYAITAPPAAPVAPTTPTTPASGSHPTPTSSSTPAAKSATTSKTTTSTSGAATSTQTTTTSSSTADSSSSSTPAVTPTTKQLAASVPHQVLTVKPSTSKVNNVALVATVSTAGVILVATIIWQLFFPGLFGWRHRLQTAAVAEPAPPVVASSLDTPPVAPDPGTVIVPQTPPEPPNDSVPPAPIA